MQIIRIIERSTLFGGVVILLAAFSCSADLLSCNPIQTEHLAFKTMPACREKAAGIASPRHRIGTDEPVVMARCRYALRGPNYVPRMAPLATAHVAEVF